MSSETSTTVKVHSHRLLRDGAFRGVVGHALAERHQAVEIVGAQLPQQRRHLLLPRWVLRDANRVLRMYVVLSQPSSTPRSAATSFSCAGPAGDADAGNGYVMAPGYLGRPAVHSCECAADAERLKQRAATSAATANACQHTSRQMFDFSDLGLRFSGLPLAHCHAVG